LALRFSKRGTEACVVTIPDGHEHAGAWSGELRARPLDKATGDWWFQIDYSAAISETRIGTFPVAWVRRIDLHDFDGIVPKRIFGRSQTASHPWCGAFRIS
jgi:hypothetical protein